MMEMHFKLICYNDDCIKKAELVLYLDDQRGRIRYYCKGHSYMGNTQQRVTLTQEVDDNYGPITSFCSKCMKPGICDTCSDIYKKNVSTLCNSKGCNKMAKYYTYGYDDPKDGRLFLTCVVHVNRNYITWIINDRVSVFHLIGSLRVIWSIISKNKPYYSYDALYSKEYEELLTIWDKHVKIVSRIISLENRISHIFALRYLVWLNEKYCISELDKWYNKTNISIREPNSIEDSKYLEQCRRMTAIINMMLKANKMHEFNFKAYPILSLNQYLSILADTINPQVNHHPTDTFDQQVDHHH